MMAQHPLLIPHLIRGARMKNTTYPIRLVITYDAGYSEDVIDVTNTNIQNVIDVASGNIGTVIGAPVSPP